jgi:hypothetical protein
MKTKTKTKILKVFAIVAIFLGNSHLMAQTVTSTDAITQTVCVNTLAEPYEVIYVSTSTYAWSIVDQATGLPPVAGVADITPSANDWLIYIDWNQTGVYELSFVETDATTLCEASPVVLTITVEDNANAPIAPNPAAICLGDANPIMSASTDILGNGNGVFNWYSDNAGVQGVLLVANAATYTEPLPLYPSAGTYSYWVTEESANECEGSATMVTVTVTGLPTAPTLANYEACFGLANPLFTASGAGTNFNWYDAGGGSLATNASTYTSTEFNPGTYSYFVEEVAGSCTSLQTSFTLIIHPPPASPSVTPLTITICEGETPQDFVVTSGGANGTYDWYNVDPVINIGAVAIGNGTPFTPTQVITGTYNYWLTETNPITTCVSNPSTATFIINPLPLVPTVTAAPSATICEFDANPIFTAVPDPLSTGTGDFYWYDADPAINPLAILLAGPIATYTPLQVAVGQYSIWIIETNSTTNCEGIALEVIFEITALPGIPLLVINPVEICFGDANPAILPIGSASGVNLLWYDDALLTSQVGTGASFTPPASAAGSATIVTTYPYWVVDQPGTCTSLPLQVDFQINPLPTPGPIWHN